MWVDRMLRFASQCSVMLSYFLTCIERMANQRLELSILEKKVLASEWVLLEDVRVIVIEWVRDPHRGAFPLRGSP